MKKKILEEYNIQVEEVVPLVTEQPHLRNYLESKEKILGHHIFSTKDGQA